MAVPQPTTPSFIQITATGGLLFTMIVILIICESMGVDRFNDWSWRVPFIFSIYLKESAILKWSDWGFKGNPIRFQS